VDILQWLEEENSRKQEEEVEDRVMKIVKSRIHREMARLQEAYTARVEYLEHRDVTRHRHRMERTQVIHRVVKAAKLAQSNPVLPEHNDTLKKRDNYL
jgi:hypothetical protein